MPHPKIKRKLEDLHITILSDNFDDAKNPDEIKLRCDKGHNMVYTFNSLCVTLNRKRSNVGENEQIELCKQCGMIKRAEEQMKKKIEELKELCEEKGHEYVNYIGSFGGHTQFVYRCGRCEEISQAFEVNMKRNLGGCAICNGINISGFKNNKADFDIVSKILSPFGHKLLKYMDCSKVVFLCFCGNPEPVTLPLTRIKTGSKCYRCLTQSRKENGMKNLLHVRSFDSSVYAYNISNM